MVTIKIIDNVKYSTGHEDGYKIYNLILVALKHGNNVTLSFEGVDFITPSFVNGALVELLTKYDFETIKKRVKIINVNPSMATLIKERLVFESGRITQSA